MAAAPAGVRLRLAPAGRWLLAASLLCAGLGFWSGSMPLAVLGQAGAMVIAALGLLTRAGAAAVSVERRHAAWAFEDEVLPVRLKVANRGRLPLRWIELSDRFTPDRETAKTLCLPGPLAARGAGELAYEGICRKRRGAYRIGPASALLADPLGCFEASATGGGETPITVFPRTVPIARMPVEGRARWDNVDTETIPKAGTSLSFSGTREYRQGDSLRFVHWGATAHTGRLVVKEFELNVATEVSVFLDAHYYAQKGMGREATFEYGVKAAASIARHMIARGSRVRLACTGKTPLSFPLGGGEFHLLTILRALTRVQPDGPDPLYQVLPRWLGTVEAGSSVVLIFSGMTMDLKAYAKSFALLKAKRVQIHVVLVDDSTFMNLWESDQHKKTHLLLLPDIIKLLAGMGITVYTIAQGDDLSERLARPYVYAPVSD